MSSLEDCLDTWTTNAMTFVDLSHAEKELRDKFCAEYISDYNSYAAALRVGFNKGFAAEWATKFMEEPYCRKKIKELELAANANAEEEAEADKRRVRAMLFAEANYHGPGSSHGARVSALAKLTAMLGMDAPIKTDGKLTITNPVQLYLPDNGRKTA